MSIRRVAVVAAVILGACVSAVPTATAAVTPPAPAACAAAAQPGFMTCHAIRGTQAISAGVVRPDLPPGYGPKDLLSAYKLPSGASAGAGAVVAVVDAYNDPTAAADLAVYRSTYGLTACTVASGCFRQVNQSGATSPLPTNDAGWAGEESLDIQMVSAICATCHIILVEAKSASTANLFAAVDEAVALGAKFVSTSWGGPESSSETANDVHLNHPGVAITAAAGAADMPSYPGSSRFVTAVGGTTLTHVASAGRAWTETAWGGSGYGCSFYEARPAWQATVATACARRAVSDVAAVADPSDGVAVYQTFGASGWVVYGGGSVPPPIIAAVYALAGTPVAGTYPASYPYEHPADLYDITAGPSGPCGPPLCTAGPGWDGPTGMGTPHGVRAFAGP